MPLNDYPTAKPTYDFYDTINAGKTGVANGVLESVTHHALDARFPGGSVTWHWHSRAPVASYLVEDSVGSYTLTSRVGQRRHQVLPGAGRVDRRGPAAGEPGHHEPAGGHRGLREPVQRAVP